MDLLTILQQSRMIEQALNIITGMQMFDRRQVREIKIHFNQFARRAVIAIGNLVGFLGRLGAAITVNFQREDNAADFLGRAHQLQPVARRQGGRSIVVIQLHINMHRTAFFLRPDQAAEISRLIGGDKSENIFEAVFFREAAMLGRHGRSQAIKARGGDSLDFSFERPLASHDRMTSERPEISDMRDLGHEGRIKLVRLFDLSPSGSPACVIISGEKSSPPPRQSRLAKPLNNSMHSPMPRIPLEDSFADVISKTQRGYKLTDAALVEKAQITASDLAALKAGEIIEPALLAVAGALDLGRHALLAHARREWYPEPPIFKRGFAMFNTPFDDMTVNSYLVWDSKTRLAAAFDTGANCQAMLDTIAGENLTLRYIFLTHTHDDHIADLDRLAASGAEVWASELEPSDRPGAKIFQENAHFHLGELAIKTLFTWGHSPGMTTFFVTGLSWPLAIVGDAIFASSMGGSATHFDMQLRNNKQKIMKLQADTVLACGHGPLTTLKQEKQHNPFYAH